MPAWRPSAPVRVEGQPVDHGGMFLHGADAEFISKVEAVDSPHLPEQNELPLVEGMTPES